MLVRQDGSRAQDKISLPGVAGAHRLLLVAALRGLSLLAEHLLPELRVRTTAQGRQVMRLTTSPKPPPLVPLAVLASSTSPNSTASETGNEAISLLRWALPVSRQPARHEPHGSSRHDYRRRQPGRLTSMPVPEGERIAALETAFKGMRDDMAELKKDVRSLVEAFNMGKGAARLIAKVGGILLLAAAAGGWVWDHAIAPLLDKH